MEERSVDMDGLRKESEALSARVFLGKQAFLAVRLYPSVAASHLIPYHWPRVICAARDCLKAIRHREEASPGVSDGKG